MSAAAKRRSAAHRPATAVEAPKVIGRSERPMPSLRPITLVDQVVEAIVRGAAEGRFLPGDRVVESDIARELNVSRVPVREALRLLESQGIVVSMPYKGMRMMDVDARHLHNVLVVRAGLEKIAARAAARVLKRDPAAAGAFDESLGLMQRAVREANGFELARADAAFHRALCRLAGNEVLLQIWEGLARRLTVIIGLSTFEKELDSICQEHTRFLGILRRGNARAIDREVDDHIIQRTESIDFERLIAHRLRREG